MKKLSIIAIILALLSSLSLNSFAETQRPKAKRAVPSKQMLKNKNSGVEAEGNSGKGTSNGGHNEDDGYNYDG